MATPRRALSRRRFLPNSATLAAGAAVAPQLPPLATAAEPARLTDFASNGKTCPDRVWLGQDYWSNPLQDWRLAGGKIECTHAAADRYVHLLVRALDEKIDPFAFTVRLGRAPAPRRQVVRDRDRETGKSSALPGLEQGGAALRRDSSRDKPAPTALSRANCCTTHPH